MSSEAQAPNPLMQEVGLDDEPEELFSTPEAKATTAKVANPLEDDLATEENSSGYASVSAPGGTGEVPRSDTLEDVSLTADSSPEKVTVSPEVGSPAEANPLEPEPEKPGLAAPNAVGEEPAFAPVRLSDHPSPPGSESAGRTSRSATQSPQPGAAGSAAAAAGADEYAEEENPFQHAHLNPQLQLSGQQPQNPNNPAFNQAIAGQNGPEISGNSQQDPEERRERDSNDDFIDIKVTEPHKIGEGMGSFLVYRVTTSTSFNFFKKKEMSVNRRFSDFLGLHDKLSEKYLQNGRIIPPAPDKSVVGMTKIKIAGKEAAGDEAVSGGVAAMANGGHGVNANGNGQPDEFVERRRAALERFLTRTASHPSLRTDPDLREFLENECELPKANQTSALSGKNVMRFLSKGVDKMTNMTVRMEETDEWFEERSQSIEALDHQLRRLHTATESLFEYRRALAINTGSMARALAVLSGFEGDSALSGALSNLAGVQEKIEQIHHEQAAADFYHLSELVKDYVGLVGAVQDVFQERVKAWQHWQSATAALTKKREAKVKAELQQRQDRVVVLREEIAEQERQQEMAQENFEKISRLIKKEVEMFDVQKAQDFKKGIVKYLEAMLKSQEDIAGVWERYLPEIKQISQ